MARNRRSRTRCHRAGAATLELALILPVFLTLTVGVIEFGRAFMVQQMITNAARDGAREASLPNSTNTDVIAKTKAFVATGGVDPTKVAVTVTPADLASVRSGTPVGVTAQVSYRDVTWVPVPWFLGQASLSSETVMRRE